MSLVPTQGYRVRPEICKVRVKLVLGRAGAPDIELVCENREMFDRHKTNSVTFVGKMSLNKLTQVYFLFHLSPSLSHTAHTEITATSIILQNVTWQFPDPPMHLCHKVPTQLTEWRCIWLLAD